MNCLLAIFRTVQRDSSLFCSDQDFYLNIQNESPTLCFFTGKCYDGYNVLVKVLMLTPSLGIHLED